jgi:predicted RNA-binding Zn-ribbon protein involved in translation (DUF1610 family)
MVDNEVTTRDSWRRFNGAWKWGIAIPNAGETVRVVCPKCGSATAESDRLSNYVYGWCTKDCGWEAARRITPEWEQQWQALSAKRHNPDIK